MICSPNAPMCQAVEHDRAKDALEEWRGQSPATGDVLWGNVLQVLLSNLMSPHDRSAERPPSWARAAPMLSAAPRGHIRVLGQVVHGVRGRKRNPEARRLSAIDVLELPAETTLNEVAGGDWLHGQVAESCVAKSAAERGKPLQTTRQEKSLRLNL